MQVLKRTPDWVWLLSFLILGAVVRLVNIGARSLWFDEAISALAVRYDLATIVSQRLEPMAPPLYLLLLGFWMRVWALLGLSANETALRGMSALFSTAAMIPVFAIGRRMFDRRTGLLAAALMMILPFQIAFAQEARSYSLIILCGALLLWAFVRALDHDQVRDWIVFGVIGMIALYVNYLLALLIVVFHLYVLLLPTRRHWLIRLALIDVVLALSLLPLVPAMLQQGRQVSALYKVNQPTVLLPLVTATFLLFGNVTDPLALIGLALFVTLALLGLVALPVVRRAVRRQIDGRLLLLLAIAMPPVIMLVLSWLIQSPYYDRWLAFVTPALVLFIAQGITPRPNALYQSLLVALIGLAAVRLVGYYTQPDAARPPFREASAYIAAQAQPGDVVFHLHDSTFASFRYYAPDLPSYLWEDDEAGWFVPAAWKWFGERTADLPSLFNGHARIWVMSLPDTLDESRRDLLAQIEARFPTAGETRFQNITVDLYADAGPK
jgi:mannosyltransferase